jgi:3-isopropylmalate dehydratase large subunit/3-isopropylmalate dehydratase small subunit
MTARTMFDKVWKAHEVVAETSGTPAVLYIDLHLIHEVTSPQAFSMLQAQGWKVRRPDRTLATLDHSTPTRSDQIFFDVPIKLDAAAKQVRQLEQNTRDFGIELFGLRDARRGIVHVISPELGSTQPGMTIVCGDSHTSTHGAFGALAFGIGSTEVGHVFATQCLLQRKPKTFAVNVNGRLGPGVTAKDLILAIIGKMGVAGGGGHVLEYRGSAISASSMEERMTICNMSIEAGARAGMIAPDETTFAYLAGRPRAPQGMDWDAAVVRWRSLASDPGAEFDASVDIDASRLEPMITYGTNPGMVLPIGGAIPAKAGDAVHARQTGRCRVHRQLYQRASRRPASRGAHPPRAQGGAGSAPAGGTGIATSQTRGRDLGARRHIQNVGSGLAGIRLLDVPRHERRHGCRRSICREHEQPQFRRPARRGRAHLARESVHGGGLRGRRQNFRPADDAVMQPIAHIRSTTVVMPQTNIDTDQIIPARFLTVTTKLGLGKSLFADWRYLGNGEPNPLFPLNQPAAGGSQVLVAGHNFGCGSSREHAPWALLDWGFRAVISTALADIFCNNSLKNGLLPVIVDTATHAWLLDHPGAAVDIDLEAMRLTLPNGTSVPFPIEAFARHCLLNGLDELGYLRSKLPEIERYESASAV